MKFTKILTRLTPVVAAFLMAFAIASTAHAIPYSGDTTPPTPGPQFNAFTGVPSEGNESDFFRGKVAGDPNPSTDVVSSSCETGKRFQLRVYVHNGATESLNNNGTGPSVAHNTKVKVDLKNSSAASQFNPNASISASNAATVNDGMTIKCTDGKVVNLSYVSGSANQFSRTGTKQLSDSIVTTGALIGTDQPDGNVWGCWTQRVYVTMLVEVKEAPKPPQESFACTLSNFVVDNRTVKIVIAPQVKNVTVIGYDVSWGDKTPNSTTQTSTHTYATSVGNGPFNIVARFQIKHADGKTEWVTSKDCTKQVTFKTTPTTPPSQPTTLVSTGTGSMAGIFVATSAVGAFLHRKWTLGRSK